MNIPTWLFYVLNGLALGTLLVFPAWLAGKYIRRWLLFKYGIPKQATLIQLRAVAAGVEFNRNYLVLRTDDGYTGTVTYLDEGDAPPPTVGARLHVMVSRRDPTVMLCPEYELNLYPQTPKQVD